MKDEIKEMLEQMESIALTGKDKNGIKVDGYGLQQNELKILLGHITILQRDNEMYAQLKDEYEEEIKELKTENERLKQPQVFIDTQDMEERYGEELYKDYLKEQLEDYKSRCEKAIEYLKNLKNYRFEFTFDSVDRHEIVGCEKNFVKDLLNILQNGSDDNE